MIDKSKQIQKDLDQLIEQTNGVRDDPSYRAVLASALQLIGHSDEDIRDVLNKLYKAN